MDEELKARVEYKTKRLNPIILELAKESDRGCCLMAAAFLDAELQELLESKLVGNKGFLKPLFEFNGPLGTFSSRMKMSFALGLITKRELDDLDTVRKIRNDFGHSYEPINFETDSLKKRIMSLDGYADAKEINTIKKKFIFCLSGLIAGIQYSTYILKKFVELERDSSHEPVDDKVDRKELESHVNKFLYKGNKKN